MLHCFDDRFQRAFRYIYFRHAGIIPATFVSLRGELVSISAVPFSYTSNIRVLDLYLCKTDRLRLKLFTPKLISTLSAIKIFIEFLISFNPWLWLIVFLCQVLDKIGNQQYNLRGRWLKKRQWIFPQTWCSKDNSERWFPTPLSGLPSVLSSAAEGCTSCFSYRGQHFSTSKAPPSSYSNNLAPRHCLL